VNIFITAVNIPIINKTAPHPDINLYEPARNINYCASLPAKVKPTKTGHREPLSGPSAGIARAAELPFSSGPSEFLDPQTYEGNQHVQFWKETR
jgi:hypothetical protein